MPVFETSEGSAVAECPRCDARVTGVDLEAAKQWLAMHWRVHDGEIGCGRRGGRAG